MLRVSSGFEEVPTFAEVVENVRSGHPDGLDQLYKVFRILSASLRRQIGFQDFDDRVHDIFIVVCEAIRQGKLREPGALTSYIYGVARLGLCSRIGARTRHERLYGSLRQWVTSQHHNLTPEQVLADRERSQIMRQMLGTLSPREREIVTRFYVYDQPKEQICEELNITNTQFRLSKSRAKQRLIRQGGEQNLNRNVGSAYAA